MFMADSSTRSRFFRFARGWKFWVAGGVGLIAFVLVVLPFLLPLGGPETVPPAALADPNGAFIEIDGETLYYVHAPGSGETVVLIHGFGGSTVTWASLVPALAAAGYDVYAIDLLGFGLSEKGWRYDYSHAAQARRVVQFMDARGIDRADIVGHSMGGDVAAYIALNYPERVNRLVLVSAAILVGDTRLSVPQFVLDVSFLRQWARLVMRHVLAPEFEGLLLGASYDDAMITPEIEAGYRRALNTPDWDLGLLGIMRDMNRSTLPAPLSDIQAPTLILWGTEDTWVSPQDGVRLEQMIPDATRVELARAGHLPMHEVPEAFNAELVAFLDRER
jgi:pimeloyl-ACP methyl ester carboxylesterase